MELRVIKKVLIVLAVSLSMASTNAVNIGLKLARFGIRYNLFKVSTSSSPVEAKDDLTQDCPICLDELSTNTVIKTSCSHIFHTDCLNDWVESGQPQCYTCPNCRTQLPKRLLKNNKCVLVIKVLIVFAAYRLFTFYFLQVMGNKVFIKG